MKRALVEIIALAIFALTATTAFADASQKDCLEAAKLFRDAGESAGYFGSSYGYAVFPTIGKAGLGIGGAHGTGCVFAQGQMIGTTKMTQLSFGWQAGAQGYSLIIFFEDQRALKEFTSGNFEFGAGVSAVAITAAASAEASTGGASAGASGGKKDAMTMGGYRKGVAPFSIVKGGLMYEAVLAGAKFSYTKR